MRTISQTAVKEIATRVTAEARTFVVCYINEHGKVAKTQKMNGGAAIKLMKQIVKNPATPQKSNFPYVVTEGYGGIKETLTLNELREVWVPGS